jgi:hypothetical protein
MQTWGVVFLGVIALASVVQAAFLISLTVFGRRLGRRIDALQARLDREITPALENFARVSRSAAEISDLAALQARRVDLLLSDAIERIEDTMATVQKLVVRPLKPLAEVLAFVRGLQRGLDVYFQLRDRRPHAQHAPQRRGHAEDDEHLFI